MSVADLFVPFLRPLNRSGIPYMVTGSLAAMHYGEPRLTNDIDLVLEVHSGQAATVVGLFPNEGFYCPPISTIRTEIARATGGHFNIICHATGFKADIYPLGKDPLDAWAMAHRTSFEVEGVTVWIAPPEYVIVYKLEYHREGGSVKHLDDIRRMLDVSGHLIDRPFLETHLARRGLLEQWRSIQAG